MLRYQSARHRRLMQESEQALEDALAEPESRAARVAEQVLGDANKLRLWEVRHAELLRPVAENAKRDPQIFALRRLETELVHRSSLIRFIREHAIHGQQRLRLFGVFYGARDINDSILREHRSYLLARSSLVSADHLIDIMHDSTGTSLLDRYTRAYRNYFAMYCYFACSRDGALADAVGMAMRDSRQHVDQLRAQLMSARPDPGYANFDQQELIARSGRYPVVNYLNR